VPAVNRSISCCKKSLTSAIIWDASLKSTSSVSSLCSSNVGGCQFSSLSSPAECITASAALAAAPAAATLGTIGMSNEPLSNPSLLSFGIENDLAGSVSTSGSSSGAVNSSATTSFISPFLTSSSAKYSSFKRSAEVMPASSFDITPSNLLRTLLASRRAFALAFSSSLLFASSIAASAARFVFSHSAKTSSIVS